jgi:hypothetical protein
MHRHVRRLATGCRQLSRFCWPVVVAAMTGTAPGHAVAAPAAEYGPEAEAGFRARCEATGMAPRPCQSMMEMLQARIGYAAFLDGMAGDAWPNGRLAAIRIAPDRPGAQP